MIVLLSPHLRICRHLVIKVKLIALTSDNCNLVPDYQSMATFGDHYHKLLLQLV